MSGNRCKTPMIFQMEATECGAASFSMVCAYWGKYVPLEQMRIVREVMDSARRSEAVGPIVEEALEHLPNLRTVWMQIGVTNAEAAARAEAAGVTVVQDKCPKIEFPR